MTPEQILQDLRKKYDHSLSIRVCGWTEDSNGKIEKLFCLPRINNRVGTLVFTLRVEMLYNATALFFENREQR